MILAAVIGFALGVVLTWQCMRKTTRGDLYP